MDEIGDNREELDEELERFITLLNQLLPHYHSLLKKDELDNDEKTRLGEIEHYLIGVNSKIMEIKGKLEQDVFGRSIDRYYKIKDLDYGGDPHSKLKLEKIRDELTKSLKAGELINFN